MKNLILLLLLSFIGKSFSLAIEGGNDTTYYYLADDNVESVLTLIENTDSCKGYFRGTTDYFDKVREGYDAGYFCLPIQELKMGNNQISFSLNSNNYKYLNRPIDISIYDTSVQVPNGYSEWLQSSKFFWGIIKFSGTYDSNSIILEEVKGSSSYKYTFERKDKKFIEEKYNRYSIDENRAYENSREFRTSGDISRDLYLPSGSTLGGHYYVDLGLPSGLLWATCNIGAQNPEDFGDYFAWGETEPKTCYNWSTYKFCDGKEKLTKYNDNPNFGKVDNRKVLTDEDDVASKKWGGAWRMPYEVECIELLEQCTWEETFLNGFPGYRVTGPNGNNIFLPVAGCKYYSKLLSGWKWANYYTKDLRGTYTSYYLSVNDFIKRVYSIHRCYGLSVRPVCEIGEASRKNIFVNWSTIMQSDYGASCQLGKFNVFLHLAGPNGGYKVWIVLLPDLTNINRIQPNLTKDVLSNKQGIYLSTVFAKEILNNMVKRASDLGLPNADLKELKGKGDVQIQSYVSAIQSMAGSNLNMSLEKATQYAENLYNAYVHFLNNRVTPSELTILCGGCDNPRYVNNH